MLRRALAGGFFQTQKRVLNREAAGVTCEPAVFADNAVAGNDDHQGVRPAGGPDRARRFLLAQRFRDFPVSRRLSVWDFKQTFPNRYLKSGSGKSDRKLESLAIAGEILLQLAPGGKQDGRGRAGSPFFRPNRSPLSRRPFPPRTSRQAAF
jgi:hypothetical protein